MIDDSKLLADVLPAKPTDTRVVRAIDGTSRLERIMNQLPEHWMLLHVAPIGNGVLAAVFSRDPAATKPGDFDHVDVTGERSCDGQ